MANATLQQRPAYQTRVLNDELKLPRSDKIESINFALTSQSRVYELERIYFNLSRGALPDDLFHLIDSPVRSLDRDFSIPIFRPRKPVISLKSSQKMSQDYGSKSLSYIHGRILLNLAEDLFLKKYTVVGLPRVKSKVNEISQESYYQLVFDLGDRSFLQRQLRGNICNPYDTVLCELLDRKHYNCTVIDKPGISNSPLKRAIFSSQVSSSYFTKAFLSDTLLIH